jgi:prepilin signal peptidase PulO-like enzyme (type II secretory pathway)
MKNKSKNIKKGSGCKMDPIFQLEKSHAIIQFLLNVIVLPGIAGIVVGSITARIKPYTLKLTLITMASISIIFLVFNLITLQNQSLPILAIILTGISIVIMNATAIISHKMNIRKRSAVNNSFKK